MDTPGARRLDHVQGLRALAVVAVVLFHAGVPLPGGFAGVDVFFVISGYVITRMLHREFVRTGRIDLRRFYVRRIRRLVPASAVLVAAVLLVGAALLLPEVLTGQVVPTALASTVFLANWAISAQSQDYFATDADHNPLLHMWSLAVEEQFYLLFPLLLLLSFRLRRVPAAAVLTTAGVGLVSVALVRAPAFGLELGPFLSGYYSPLLRAWEFAAGALLALLTARGVRGGRSLAWPVGLVGWALVLFSFFRLDENVPWPGKATFVPVGGTVLLLLAGLAASDPGTRLLSSRPMTRIGDLSYSLYLWHWPPLVVVASVWPTSSVAPVLAVAAGVMLAVLSYRYVEEPFRHGRFGAGRVGVRGLVGLVAIPLVLAGLAWVLVPLTTALPYERANDRVEALARADRTPRVPCPRQEMAGVIGSNGLCLGTGVDPADVVVVGDSHSEVLYPGIVEQAEGREVSLYSIRSPRFFGGRERVEDLIRTLDGLPAPSTLLVARHWVPSDLTGETESSLVRLVGHAQSRGSRVVLLDDVATFPFDVEQCLYQAAPAVPTRLCSVDRDDVAAGARPFARMLDRVAAGTGAGRVSLLGPSCPGARCVVVADGRPLYSDGDHLTVLGARQVVGRLVEEDPTVGVLLRP